MLRSHFPAAMLVALFILACGEEDPVSNAGDAGAGGSSGSPAVAGAGTGGSGGSGSTAGEGGSGGSGSTAGVGGVGGRCGIITGGTAGSGGVGATGGSATAGSGGTGGSAGASEPAPECAGLDPYVGGIALPADFSLSEGVAHEHTLSMDRGSMIRRQLDYQTTGSADHQHQVRFTDEQLAQLMAGETIVVETEGPPLNASSGHSHTVTVHPCLASSPL